MLAVRILLLLLVSPSKAECPTGVTGLCEPGVTEVIEEYPDGRYDIITTGQKIFKLENHYKNKFFYHNDLLANQFVSKSIYGAMPKILFEAIIILITFSLIIYFSINNLPLKDLFAQILIYSVAVFRLLPSITGLARHEQKIK